MSDTLEKLRAKLVGLWTLVHSDQSEKLIKEQVSEILDFFRPTEIEGLKILSKYL